MLGKDITWRRTKKKENETGLTNSELKSPQKRHPVDHKREHLLIKLKLGPA